MSGWLRENWKWIVVPILLLVGVIVLVALFGRNDTASPFQYTQY